MYFWESQRGPSRARNRGILESRGRILAFVDDDETVSEDWAKLLVDDFSNPEVTVVTGTVLDGNPDSAVGSTWFRLCSPSIEVETWFDASSNIPFSPVTAGKCGCANNMAFRRSFFFQHGLFDIGLGTGILHLGYEEIDRFYVVLKTCGKILFDPAVRVHHAFMDNRAGFLRKVFGYAAGQSAYLTK
jgi:glycosyltransferase involved in cell wall biosynthesis